jgi:hypothetical protein
MPERLEYPAMKLNVFLQFPFSAGFRSFFCLFRKVSKLVSVPVSGIPGKLRQFFVGPAYFVIKASLLNRNLH